MYKLTIAVFGNKSFEVSSNKILTFSDFTLSGGLTTESQELQGSKPSTYIKGLELEKIGFNIMLDSSFGLDVLDEVNYWRWIRDLAIPRTFVLGDAPLSSNKWLLKTVNVTNTIIDNYGRYKKASVALDFEEYVREGSANYDAEKKANTAAAKKTSTQKSNVSADDILDKTGKRDNPNASSAIANGTKK